MTEFNVLSYPRQLLWMYLIVGPLLFLVGVMHFIIQSGGPFELNTFSAILNMILGGVFIIQYFIYKRSDKYFVRKNESTIEWFLPEMDAAQVLNISDIVELEESWKQIESKTKDNDFIIPLKEFEWKESTSIRQAFKEVVA